MTETESAILAHARRCAPAESCGFVVRAPEGERYFPGVNISGEPEDYFRMAPEDWLQAEMQGEIVADGAVFPGRIMLANTCTWTYRGDECGYHGPAVADEYDQPTSDITKDKCSKCLSGCKFRNNVGNFGGFLSINKLSQ
ncbi:phage minor tail protein L [Shigella sonnei]|nr:phage minor tail protein L [Shigella sonnei]